jgi:hypothetical protein
VPFNKRMNGTALISLDVMAAALLALWVLVRYPGLGPRSLVWAMAAFVMGQFAPFLGVRILLPVLRLPHGLVLATVGVVLPVFFAWFLTVAWLFRAILAHLGGPGGGHRVRGRYADSRL